MFTASSTTVIPPMCTPPNLSRFNEVSENEVLKIIKNSPTKLCLFDPVPTFLLKHFVEILLPSITKLVNLSLAEGVLPQNSRRWLSLPSLKKHHSQMNLCKIIDQYQDYVSCQNWWSGYNCQTVHATYQ